MACAGHLRSRFGDFLFVDLGGLLLEPALFQRTVDILVERYQGLALDKIGGCVGGERLACMCRGVGR